MRVAQRIAHAGGAPSRRSAEALILAGHVRVNGRTIDSPALDVTPDDQVAVRGKPLPSPARPQLHAGGRRGGGEAQPAVVLVHKLRGELVTRAGTDDLGRRTVGDRLAAMGVLDAETGCLARKPGDTAPAALGSLVPVGRLDFNSEGLLLFTSDRALSRYLELPASAVARVYRVRVYGFADRVRAAVAAWQRGPTVDGVAYRPAAVQVLDSEEVKRKYGEEEGAPAAAAVRAPTAGSSPPASPPSRAPGGPPAPPADEAEGDAPAARRAAAASSGTKMNTWLQVTLTEGKNRELRRVAEAFDLTVTRLVRVAYGPFSLKGLGPGDAKLVAPVPRWLLAKAHAAAAAAAAAPEPPGGPPRRAAARDHQGASEDPQRRAWSRPPSRRPRTAWEGAAPLTRGGAALQLE